MESFNLTRAHHSPTLGQDFSFKGSFDICNMQVRISFEGISVEELHKGLTDY